MRLDPTTLQTICESIALRGSLAAAARAAGIGESTLHRWLVDSKRAAERHDEKSPLFFEWQSKSDFLHAQIQRAKSAGCLSLLYQVMEEARAGISEPLFDPSTNRPLQKLVPATAHRSREWFEAQGLDYDIDRYEWIRDPITDEILAPVIAYKTTMIPASLRQKILTGLIPSVFAERAELDVKHSGQVVHRVQPADYVPRAQREPVIDASFSEVSGDDAAGVANRRELPAPALRPDIEQLRAEAARLMREGPKHPTPQGVVKQADGRPVGSMRPLDDKPDDVPLQREPRPMADHPRAYVEPKPQPGPDRPAGQYPAGTDPRGRKAMKVS